ncbi:carbohydrate binding domain-containing protein, partial [Anaerostipes hadrus]|uniref:carbohydrate binding domain-containing protein n=1 Tax=Anaerostipes hadrus TaxID=649756 RepID=UPI001D070AB4
VFNVEPNTTYIFRAKIKGSTNSTTMDVYFLGSKTAKTGIGGSYDYIHLLATGTTNKNDWQEYITKFTTNSDEICGYVRIDNNASSNGSNSSVYFSQIKLEKG